MRFRTPSPVLPPGKEPLYSAMVRVMREKQARARKREAERTARERREEMAEQEEEALREAQAEEDQREESRRARSVSWEDWESD